MKDLTAQQSGLQQETYEKLSKLAARHLQRNTQLSFSKATVVHETYIRMAQSRELTILDDEHYLAVAAQGMRWFISDAQRKVRQVKRGGGWRQVEFHDYKLQDQEDVGLEDILAFKDALGQLAEKNVRQAQVAELRIFEGLQIDEIATNLGISPRCVDRDWHQARCWIKQNLRENDLD